MLLGSAPSACGALLTLSTALDCAWAGKLAQQNDAMSKKSTATTRK